MKRFHSFLLMAALFFAARGAIIYDVVDVGASSDVKWVATAVRWESLAESMQSDTRGVCVCCQLPWYLLMVLGCYALLCIGIDFFNFTDITPASTELAQVS